MKNGIIWLLVGLAIIIVLIVLLFFPAGPKEVNAPSEVPPTPPTGVEKPSSDTDNNAQETLLPSRFVVTMNDQGFSPKELQIKKGDTIEFINAGSRPHWPASAVHPVHTDYPEGGGCIGSAFDACEGVKPGEAWSFTFNQVGTWKYHDHLSPSLTGVIVVTE